MKNIFAYMSDFQHFIPRPVLSGGRVAVQKEQGLNNRWL